MFLLAKITSDPPPPLSPPLIKKNCGSIIDDGIQFSRS